jgi:hypothetical protein
MENYCRSLRNDEPKLAADLTRLLVWEMYLSVGLDSTFPGRTAEGIIIWLRIGITYEALIPYHTGEVSTVESQTVSDLTLDMCQ